MSSHMRNRDTREKALKEKMPHRVYPKPIKRKNNLLINNA